MAELYKDTNWISHKDGSIYHLKLLPGELAEKIITVGDPQRVQQVSNYFDSILTHKQYREFTTVTGILDSQKISVVSTGIGVDNVDIVINEIDYLFNGTALQNRNNDDFKTLTFIRLGTSGAIQETIPLDSLLISRQAIHRSSFLSHYPCDAIRRIRGISALDGDPEIPVYSCPCDEALLAHFRCSDFMEGTTMTCDGFYVPQGRFNRLSTNNHLKAWKELTHEDFGNISNLEMETAGIYGLSKYFGHRALSINAILANRISQQFSSNPEETIEKMIQLCLEKILTLT